MDRLTKEKLMEAGYVIVRTEDVPVVRIKKMLDAQGIWVTLEKFDTKSARDRRLKWLLINDQKIITE